MLMIKNITFYISRYPDTQIIKNITFQKSRYSEEKTMLLKNICTEKLKLYILKQGSSDKCKPFSHSLFDLLKNSIKHNQESAGRLILPADWYWLQCMKNYLTIRWMHFGTVPICAYNLNLCSFKLLNPSVLSWVYL